MARVRVGGETVRHFILENVEAHASDIAKLTAGKFHITRQAVNKHLQKLVADGALRETGQTRNRVYSLVPLIEWENDYELSPELAEDVIWRKDIRPLLEGLPENVIEAWQFGFTEMMNNAIDHSGGIVAVVRVRRTAGSTEMLLGDNGVGIFKKIQAALRLEDQRHAVLELAKGKFTTDPQRHSGEGIFFTSRIFDSFSIHSGGVFFFHCFGTPEDWVLEGSDISGTTVRMSLSNHTTRQVSDVFGQFHTADDFGFTKTIVPVRLAQYGDDNLVSRSQAKRVLARIQLFKSVIFDFEGVDSIGQAFADEIFRVFAKLHPAIDISVVNASPRVNQMVQHARAANVVPAGSESLISG